MIDNSGISDTPFMGWKHTFCIADNVNSSLMPSTAAWKLIFHRCNSWTVFEQWFTTMWRISQWRSIQWYTWHVGRTPAPPGDTPPHPRGDALMSLLPATTAAKNGGKKPSTTTPFTGTLIRCIGLSNVMLFFDCKNTLKAACSFASGMIGVMQSSKAKYYVVTAPETRCDTPETTFLHPTTTTPSTTGVSVSSSFPSWHHHQPKMTVLKMGFGFWKFNGPLPCCTTPRKCQQLHHHRTLALNPRAKYWDAIGCGVSIWLSRSRCCVMKVKGSRYFSVGVNCCCVGRERPWRVLESDTRIQCFKSILVVIIVGTGYKLF